MNLVGGSSPFWRGGLGIGKRRPRPSTPVAGADAAVVIAGGTVEIDVLENDIDPAGAALTLANATADQGTVVITPANRLIYTAPANYAGMATLSYTAASTSGASARGTVSVEVLELQIADGSAPGEFVTGTTMGALTVTVIAPAENAGDYAVQVADLAGGPVCLVPPRIAGTAATGTTLSAEPGLWVFNAADAPLAFGYKWLRDGVAVEGDGAAFTVSADDEGRRLVVVETASLGSGAREAASEGLDVPEAPVEIPTAWTPSRLTGLTVWYDPSDPVTVTVEDGAVTKIADKSGHRRDALPHPGAPGPTLAATLAGRPVLRFPPNGALKSGGPPLPDLPGMPGVTVFAVTQAHVAAGFNECFALRNGTGAGGEAINLQTGYSIMWFGNGNRYWTRPASGPVLSVARYAANGTHAETEWWQDGAPLSPTSIAKGANGVALPADAYLQLGNPGGPTSEQAELLLVMGPVTAEDRARAEGYLAHKWGLAGALPEAHPYRAAPPEN